MEGSLPELERWLAEQRLDLLVGGLVAAPERSARFQVSVPYLTAHLGLVVADDAVRRIQDLGAVPLERPLQLAVMDPALLTPNLRERIDQLFGRGWIGVRIEPIASRCAFFSAAGLGRFDGLLTTTEGGAAWSVVYPSTTLLAPFGSALPVRLALVIGGSDLALSNDIDSWLLSPDAQETLRDLYGHWILMQEGSAAEPRAAADRRR